MTIRLQASVQSLVFVIMLAATLFGTAGRCDIIEFWVYIAIVQMQTGYPALFTRSPCLICASRSRGAIPIPYQLAECGLSDISPP